MSFILNRQQVTIKVDRITPRICYTFDFVFKERGFDYELVTEGTTFSLDYSSTAPSCSNLLYSDDLPEHLPDFDSTEKVFVFDGKKDYVASVFFVLSRMEEYMIREKDQHGRFSAQQSLLLKHGLLEEPACDFWAVYIIEKLLGYHVEQQSVHVEPTFDIDNTYAYKHKSGKRRLLSVLRDLLQGNKKRLSERKAVDRGERDPYDTFDTIESVAQEFDATRIFWLVESGGDYDRNLRIDHPAHLALIQRMSKAAAIGIHPSYASFQRVDCVANERKKLGAIVGTDVQRSRQHYLRFSLPESYRTLLEAGILHDYSMGFADAYGFRNGTSRSFAWFDVSRNEITELMVHPFAYMDGTLNEYLGLSPDESKEVIGKLFDSVQQYGGVFRFIWHNETIGDYGKWAGWKSVLDFSLELGADINNEVQKEG